MRRSLLVCLLLTLSLSLSSVALADQSFLLSKRAKNFNFDVQTARDPNTGNMLVVWTEIKPSDSSYGRVWAALLKRKANGTYQRRNDNVISPKNGYHNEPHVAWSEAAKAFVVVWTTRRGPLDPGNILARLVKATNGKPKGAVKTIVADGKINHGPYVVTGENAAAGMQILYLSEPDATRAANDGPNLNAIPVGTALQTTDDVAVLAGVAHDFQSNRATINVFTSAGPPDRQQLIDCGVAAVTVIDGGQLFLELYVVRGERAVLARTLKDVVFIDLYVDPRAGKDEAHVVYWDPQTGTIEDLVFTEKGQWGGLRPPAAPAWRTGDASTRDATAAPRQDLLPAVRYAGVTKTDTAVNAFYINVHSVVVGPAPLFEHGGTLTGFGTDSLLGPEERSRHAAPPLDRLVWWLKSVPGAKQQVRAHLYLAEK